MKENLLMLQILPWEVALYGNAIKTKSLAWCFCEHLGASSWWPNKDHLSDKPDSMQISLEIPVGYQASQAVISGKRNRSAKATTVLHGLLNILSIIIMPLFIGKICFFF
jgi:hypothetical protein